MNKEEAATSRSRMMGIIITVLRCEQWNHLLQWEVHLQV